MNSCYICNSEKLGEPIYSSAGNISITSMSEIYPSETRVYFCNKCAHVQTPEIANIDEYYNNVYKVLIDSEDEDQLYEIKEGKKIFRYDYQAEVILTKINLPDSAKILDYGCAKGTTLKKLVQRRPDIQPYLFDISEMYIPFWEKFAAKDNWSVYKTKPEWKGTFDLITSFFSLEHAKDPRLMLADIFELLKPSGIFYFIVPNPLTNVADLIVADHVNHFTETSIEYLLKSNSFTDISIDTDTHNNAFIVYARKTDKVAEFIPDRQKIQTLSQEFNSLARYWESLSEKILEFKQTNPADKIAIYGSGFYGAFIVSCLDDLGKVACFIDQSPFRQGKILFGKPIVKPADLPPEINTVYVGLNPNIARREISRIEEWKNRNINYFFP